MALFCKFDGCLRVVEKEKEVGSRGTERLYTKREIK